MAPRHVWISPRPELDFEARIAAVEAAFSGRLGVHAVRLDDGESFELRADEPFPTASVIKVAVCCAVLDLVARGQADLRQTVRLPARGQRVAGGGILKQLELDTLSLADAIELTVTLSENVATNALLDVCGTDRVNEYARELGLAQTRILGPVDFTRIGPGLEGGIGISTPREQTRLLTALAQEQILTAELCRYLTGVLARQHYQDQIPRWIPWNPYAQYHARHQPLTVANKTGELDGIRADAALLMHETRGTVALAVFTDGGHDLRESVDVEGALAVAECGAAVAARLLGLAT
ncbi:MAG TPA: serine hydrolase [Solirubrobacteraceae bacterium]|nr:serine hydrolase [Solirubrobacteraceae bacterium]